MKNIKRAASPPPTVEPTATVKEVVSRMAHEYGCAVAVVGGGKFLGTLSKGDVITRVVEAGLDPAKTLVKDVMTPPQISITPSTKAEEALKLMAKHRQCFLPVTDSGGVLKGWLAVCELYQDRFEDLAGEVDSLVAYMSVDGPGG